MTNLLHMEPEQVRSIATQFTHITEDMLLQARTLLNGVINAGWQGASRDEFVSDTYYFIQNLNGLIDQGQALAMRVQNEVNEWLAVDSNGAAALKGTITPLLSGAALPLFGGGHIYSVTETPMMDDYLSKKLPSDQMVIFLTGVNTDSKDGQQDGQWLNVLDKAGYSKDQILQFSYGQDYKALLKQAEAGESVDVNAFNKGYNKLDSTSLNFQEDQEQLAAFVKLVQLQHPDVNLTLAGHSKGGIVAAGSMQFLDANNPVKNVITFGSPHDGGDIGSVVATAAFPVLGASTPVLGNYIGDQLTHTPLLQNSDGVQFVAAAGDADILATNGDLSFPGVDTKFKMDTDLLKFKDGKFLPEFTGHSELANTDEAARIIRWTVENSMQNSPQPATGFSGGGGGGGGGGAW